MARPTGWDVLGLDGDPTPGVVESVEALAKEFGDFAHDVEAAWRNLNSFGGDASALQWIGQTADAFKSNFGPLPGRLQKLYTSYSEASDALSAYAPKLLAAQNKADAALRQAQDAHADLQRATTTANSAAADLKTAQQNQAAAPNPQAVTDAQTAHDTAQRNLDAAKGRLDALAAQARQAHDDRIAAAKECAEALHHAQSDGIHNKHWWEHVGQALSEWGGKIAEIANDLAPFLDVLALATSWIPGVDVITAGLAEADNIIAMAGTGMEIAGDTMQGHFSDALMNAGMLGATFLGGKAISKLGGKAFESLSSKFGKEAEDAENAVGAKTRIAGGVKNANKVDDPVDVVSGWMLTDAVDLELPGVLPVVLRRAYMSGYTTGHLFGPGWSSTLDQRLSINEAGIHFVGDDAQRLDYPIPTGDQAVMPARGDRWPLVWDRDTDEIMITDPWSGQTRHFTVVHHRAELGQIRDLTALSDRNGNRITIERDEQGTPKAVVHPAYRIAVDTMATAAGPRVTGLRLLDDSGDESGTETRRFRYDSRGRLSQVVNSSGVPFTYEWDDSDRIAAWVDQSGYRYGYVYDAIGRVIRGEGTFLAGSLTYDPENHTTVHTNSLGHVTTFRYDDNGHVTSITDPLGNTTITQTDAYGRVLSSTDAVGATTVFERDQAGDIRRVITADGAVAAADYNEFHRAVAITGSDGTRWTRQYDERGNLVQVTDPAGAVTRFEYNASGALSSSTDAVGNRTRFITDAAGLVVAQIDPLGNETRAIRDSAGRVIQVVDPLGAVTRFEWTPEGLPVSRTDPNGASIRWRHDATGRLLEAIDPIGATTRFEPGPMGTLVARTGPDGVRHSYEYDSELNLLAVVNPDGGTWKYTYDPAGRLIGESDFVGRNVGYSYDAAGRLVGRTTGAGQQITLVRDSVGRVVARQTPEGNYGYTYDAAGRLAEASGPGSSLAYEYDLLGRVLAERVNGRVMRYAYDDAGRQIRRVTPSGAESVWEYDAAGRPIRLNAGTGRLDLAFDGAGREIQRALGAGGWLVRQYDAAGRPVAERLGTSGQHDADPLAIVDPTMSGTVLSRTWAWRSDGVPEEIRDSLRGTRRIVSDTAGRVTAVSAQGWTETYAYDAYGNLTADVAVPGTAASDATDAEPMVATGTLVRRSGRAHYEYDDAGRLVRTTRRTLDGRRKSWEYSWDSQDRLVEVATPDRGTWRYSYDPVGRRTGKYRVADDGTAAEQVSFAWDGPRLAEQQMPVTDGTTVTLTWDYDPGTYRPAAQRRRSWVDGASQGRVDEAFHAIVTDLVGAPTELVTPDGHIAWRATRTAWGHTVEVGTDPGLDCPLRFPGQYHDDETGLHYNLYRYYSPDTAAYLTPDPLGLAPSPNDHSYVLNPFAFADPLGLYETAAPAPGAAGEPKPGLAQLNYYPGLGPSGHFSIEVTDGETVQHMDLWPYDGKAVVRNAPDSLPAPAISHTFEVPDVKAAFKYMSDVKGPAGDYNPLSNSCLTFCTKTLSAGGVDAPIDKAAIPWAKRLMGGGR